MTAIAMRDILSAAVLIGGCVAVAAVVGLVLARLGAVVMDWASGRRWVDYGDCGVKGGGVEGPRDRWHGDCLENAAGQTRAAPPCSVLRCVGNAGGCEKQGDDRCTITVNGPPTQASESLYMCPFNHWRSTRWEITPNTKERRMVGPNCIRPAYSPQLD
jgi:hypothetical protein